MATELKCKLRSSYNQTCASFREDWDPFCQLSFSFICSDLCTAPTEVDNGSTVESHNEWFKERRHARGEATPVEVDRDHGRTPEIEGQVGALAGCKGRKYGTRHPGNSLGKGPFHKAFCISFFLLSVY